MITKLGMLFSDWSRKRRAKIFHYYLRPTEKDRILDLGSEDGRHIASIIPFRENVFIADIDQESLLRGEEKYGFKKVLLDEVGRIPFEDKYFDIVYCNSVIEHVGIDKAQQWSVKDGKEFSQMAFNRQCDFASEIRRVGKKYFVQTPNKNFVLESHTWLPLVQFLPRPTLIKIIRWLNKWWIKKTVPDWNLLTEQQMKELFPHSIIVEEKFLGLTKSLIAIRNFDLQKSEVSSIG